jgi:prepilin-type N-terminal cleavage/methylation domain-containing protein
MKITKLASKGFSLVEMLVVIAIIGVIAAIAVPQISDFTDAAKLSKHKRNAQNLASVCSAAQAAGLDMVSTSEFLVSGPPIRPSLPHSSCLLMEHCNTTQPMLQ